MCVCVCVRYLSHFGGKYKEFSTNGLSPPASHLAALHLSDLCSSTTVTIGLAVRLGGGGRVEELYGWGWRCYIKGRAQLLFTHKEGRGH